MNLPWNLLYCKRKTTTEQRGATRKKNMQKLETKRGRMRRNGTKNKHSKCKESVFIWWFLLARPRFCSEWALKIIVAENVINAFFSTWRFHFSLPHKMGKHENKIKLPGDKIRNEMEWMQWKCEINNNKSDDGIFIETSSKRMNEPESLESIKSGNERDKECGKKKESMWSIMMLMAKTSEWLSEWVAAWENGT